MADVLFGLDIGTTKICAIVGEVRDKKLQIVGFGMSPSHGMKRGMVVNVKVASQAIAAAVEEAEQSSGYQLSRALVSMAGEHLQSHNSRGIVSINPSETISKIDIERALASAIKNQRLPETREMVHIVPRAYKVDDQAGVTTPLGMHGNQLEIESHIITASSVALKNLQKCTADVGLKTDDFVINMLASAEAVLDSSERDVGVIVIDIGGGTSDVALYKDGTVWHTDVIPIGGEYFTQDIAIGLRVPLAMAEQIKIQHSNCRPHDIDPTTNFQIKPFSGERIEVGLQELAFVVEARAEELFEHVIESLKRSGYDGLLPAGVVLTGGGAQLRNLREVAERKLGVPARIAKPHTVVGLVDRLQSPKYATAIGLLQFAMTGQNTWRPNYSRQTKRVEPLKMLGRIGKVFLPG